ncbi:hypothetical protein [Planctobacterium marinum]|uniref:Uncharacterized protein n=1 Tax=Planctobacterium marinum TaxID=1631968 RepID=A0AA48KSZ3_9ALTE|nr:hypothetical protein MACH26_25150 [Planctobacterium marinum]
MSNPEISLVIEPWTTANTHFNLYVENIGDPDESLVAEFSDKKFVLNDEFTFIDLIFNGTFANNGDQTANLVFNLQTPGYSFRKRDDGIKNITDPDKFNVSATLPTPDDRKCIVTINNVDIEKASFSFNFDIKSSNGGKDHLFDPDLDVERPPIPK